MKYEDVLFHPYYENIKKKCFDDEPGTKISNWVKNTVDADDKIPTEKKAEYYLSDRKINAYRALLKEQTKSIAVDMEKASAMAPTAPKKLTDGVGVTTDEKKTYAPLIVKDAERNMLVVTETFLNMFVATQNRLLKIMEKADEYPMLDTGVERTIRGFMSELRQMFELYCKMTGREEFAKAVGQTAGQVVADNVMSETKKAKLREFVRNLLGTLDPQEIPTKLSELEEILNG